MYETIDHTADIGVRVGAPNLRDLFVSCASALADISVDILKNQIPSIDVPIFIEAPCLEELLVKWLQEILFVSETRRLVLSSFWIDEIDERHLIGSAKGAKYDTVRHRQKLLVKGVTYHNIDVSKHGDGSWSAKIIFDV